MMHAYLMVLHLLPLEPLTLTSLLTLGNLEKEKLMFQPLAKRVLVEGGRYSIHAVNLVQNHFLCTVKFETAIL